MAGCFTGSTKGANIYPQVPKYTGSQMELLASLTGPAREWVDKIPMYGSIPPEALKPYGAAPLQQQAFDYMSALPEQFAFDPNKITAAMAPVGQAARGLFGDLTEQIMGRLPEGMTRASGVANILGREGRRLSENLAAQFAPMQYQGYESALNRQQQLPQQLAALGTMQYGIPEAQRLFDLQRWQAGTIEASPRAGLLGSAFMQPYDTLVQQGFWSPGVGTQLLNMIGSIAGSFGGMTGS